MMYLLFYSKYVKNGSLLRQIKMVMTIKEVLALAYGSTQSRFIKHFESWFSTTNKGKTKCAPEVPMHT